MNDNLLKISLNQGKQFNTYQTKIKKNITNTHKSSNIKEGFVTLEQEQIVRPSYNGYSPVLKNIQQTTSVTNSANQKDLDELKQLQSRYNELTQQYTDIQKTIGESSLNTINRLGSNNPYLGKNIMFTDGTVVYVTSQGIVKPYTSQEIFDNTSGKNGCPKDLIKINIPWSSSYIKGATIPTNPTLIVGSSMTLGEGCGNEGSNVYASKLINNPSSTYIGCYNDKPPSTNVNVVPVMNSSNNVNSFISVASSIYLGNNNSVGPWAAFDQNPNTFWHSEVSTETNYNSATGIYEGTNSVNITNIGTVGGEFLEINMPGINTDSAQNITVNQYSLAPRLDLITTRSPNSWYVIGYKDSQWIKVDRLENQKFTNGTPKVYNVSNPGAYSAYGLLIDKVGNDDQTNDRNCVQVSEWNLFTNSDSMDENRAMILNTSALGYTSFDKCQEYAVDNGYNYFGLQDVQSDGTSSCLVSNDITRTKIYGDASSKTTIIPIWSSNTSGLNAKLDTRGILYINDTVGKILWQSSEKEPNNCSIQYSISESTNAPGNDLGYYKNVTLDFCKSECTNNEQCYGIALNNNNDCWTKSQFQNIKSEENISLYQKVKSTDNCKFLLILQDDGNLCIYQGTPDNIINPSVWSTMSTGKQIQPNTEWEASKGTFGRNYIIGGEVLSINQWIGSNNGSIKLIMQGDGNLVLYTSETKQGCKVINDKTYGGGWINAVYQLNGTGNKSTLGKIGYVDSESNLREYPDSMIGFTNDYQIYQNTDSYGNDITNLITTDQNGCQTACNNNPDCAAYAYMPSSNTCWLKNRSTYPKADKYPQNDRIFGVRIPGLKGSTTCSNKVLNVDTIQYDSYNKGTTMSSDTQCNIPVVSQSDQVKFDNIKSQLMTLGNDIVSKMQSLNNQDKTIFQKLNTNAEQFKKDLENYKLTNLKIKKELNLQSNNIEGMRNLLNINDLNGMLSDSDLRVLQENYSYIMWSILAVGILTITINTIKK
jgi:hypothetical protein